MNKITVLDGFTLNPGDLSWEELEKLGDVAIYSRTPYEKILERCNDSNIVLTNKTKIDRNIISNLPKLKYIGVLATGFNIVDTLAAKENRIVVCNIPAYSTHSVAQLTFGMIIDQAEDLYFHFNSVKKGKWQEQEDFSYTTRTTRELTGKTLGIIGYGQIARQVIKLAIAFEMKVLVYTSNPGSDGDFIRFVDKKELFMDSDYISINTSLRADNKEIIDRESLGIMKRGAFIINTSRGGLINEQDLADFLNNELIAGASLDVLSVEPPDSGNPLLKAKNCRITPHIAWSTIEARKRLLELTISNIRAFTEDHPVNVVN